MYNIGTVTTTANSTKLIGVGTKWKENISLVSPQQIIQIMIGTMVYDNSIHSIQSNTELTLNFPIPVAAKDAKYVILTTMVDSVTDAGNKIVTMNIANVQYADIQNRIMTETGVIDVRLPDGTTRKTRTEAERDKLLDGKLDKTGGVVAGNINAEGGLITAIKDNTFVQLKATDAGKPALLSSPDNKQFNTHNLQSKSGTIMHLGDCGFGGLGEQLDQSDWNSIKALIAENKSRIYNSRSNNELNGLAAYAPMFLMQIGNTWANISINHTNGRIIVAAGYNDFKTITTVYSTANTTKDSNGNLKAASPIVKVFADHIELNEESEGVELEKLGTGRYKLKGVLGMNSDASWGGIHGGMVIPNGINNLPLVWGSFDVLPDGDIIIETRYRKHELNERQEAERLMTYPEFLKDELVEVDTEEGKQEKLLKVEREDYEYCDIPNGHWIDVRVNMPSNSIYNLKQAEAERLAKEAAEKQAEEDAKREEEDSLTNE